MGFVVKFVYNSTSSLASGNVGVLIGLTISAAIGALSYAILIYLLKVEEFNLLVNQIKHKFIK